MPHHGRNGDADCALPGVCYAWRAPSIRMQVSSRKGRGGIAAPASLLMVAGLLIRTPEEAQDCSGATERAGTDGASVKVFLLSRQEAGVGERADGEGGQEERRDRLQPTSILAQDRTRASFIAFKNTRNITAPRKHLYLRFKLCYSNTWGKFEKSSCSQHSNKGVPVLPSIPLPLPASLSNPMSGTGAKITRQVSTSRRAQKPLLSEVTHRQKREHNVLFSLKDILKPSNITCFKCTERKCVKQMVRNSPIHHGPNVFGVQSTGKRMSKCFLQASFNLAIVESTVMRFPLASLFIVLEQPYSMGDKTLGFFTFKRDGRKASSPSKERNRNNYTYVSWSQTGANGF